MRKRPALPECFNGIVKDTQILCCRVRNGRLVVEMKIVTQTPKAYVGQLGSHEKAYRFDKKTGIGLDSQWRICAIGPAQIAKYRHWHRKVMRSTERTETYQPSVQDQIITEDSINNKSADVLAERVRIHFRNGQFTAVEEIVKAACKEANDRVKELQTAAYTDGVGFSISLLGLPRDIENAIEDSGYYADLYALCNTPRDEIAQRVFSISHHNIDIIERTLDYYGFAHCLSRNYVPPLYDAIEDCETVCSTSTEGSS